MKTSIFNPLLLLLTVLATTTTYQAAAVAVANHHQGGKKTYIVHMDKSTMPVSYTHHSQWYDASLKSATDTSEILYVYTHTIHGFSARLTPEEAKSLEGQKGVLSVLEEVIYELHTTRTPEFLGLQASNEALHPDSSSASDVVVGVLDTGIWAESKSYDDTGLGPVPSSWKGQCEEGTNFKSSYCNRKLVGARFFSKGYEEAYGPVDPKVESRSPLDDDGHGTHTSTTAVGSAVAQASLFGYAQGTARGMAPHARLAAYKVCWEAGCFGSDIVAGMDKAVEDGVDILSLSIGGTISDYDRDSVAVGAFGAMSKGIFVSCSAGNSGPGSMTLSNVAPWITTVGAGTLDRDFPAYVRLGNGKNFSGESLYSGKPLTDALVPLVYGGKASNSSSGNLCMSGSLVPDKVAGKIVVCDRGLNPRVQKGLVVRDAGGLGMILANTNSYGEELVADSHLVPAATVGQIAGDTIKKYMSTDANPTATISFAGTQLGVQPSPVVAAFSSRGPNPVTPEILKPDLLAPGVNILAGWTGAVGPSGLPDDKRRVGFNIISGTSMSCPHVSGLAALIKGSHPDWSPAAIKSALMTTSYSTYKNGKHLKDIATGQPSTPFDYGAGHVNPVAALDPGLVYDATVEDYVGFLCALNYTSGQIRTIAKQDYSCDAGKKYYLGDLNYPSFAVPLQTSSGTGGSSGEKTTVKYTRTLTNVGKPGTYKALLTSVTASVKITIEPESLTFAKVKENKSYVVTFTGSSMPSGTNSFAHLEWSDGEHTVRSPIAFSWT